MFVKLYDISLKKAVFFNCGDIRAFASSEDTDGKQTTALAFRNGTVSTVLGSDANVLAAIKEADEWWNGLE